MEKIKGIKVKTGHKIETVKQKFPMIHKNTEYIN